MKPEHQEQFENEVEETRKMKTLKNKFLDKFFEDKEAQLFNAFKNCPLGDEKVLAGIHMAYKSMHALQSEVQSVMNTGKMAEMSLAPELDKLKH